MRFFFVNICFANCIFFQYVVTKALLNSEYTEGGREKKQNNYLDSK